MTYRKITAVVRCTELDEVERALQEAGVRGLTMTHVRGYGQHANYYRDDWTVTHARLELFLEQSEVDRVVDIIKRAACSGVVAVMPVEEFHHIHENAEEASRAADVPQA